MGTWPNRIGGGILEAPAGLTEVGSGVQLYAADWRQVVDNLAHGGRGLAQLLMGATGLQLAGTACASGDTVPAGVWLLRDNAGYLIERRTTGPTAIEWIDTAGDLALYAVPALRDDALVDPGDADAASADPAAVRFVAQLAISAAPTYGLKLGEGPAVDSAFTGFTEEAELRVPVLSLLWRFAGGLQIGDGTDGTFYLTAHNADANKPAIRYSHTANAWQYSNDGTTWADFGAGVGAMEDFDLAPDAGDVLTVDDGAVVNVVGGSAAVQTTGTAGTETLEVDLVLAEDGGLEVIDDVYGTGLRATDALRAAALYATLDGRGSDVEVGQQVDLYVPFDCTIVAGVLLNDAAGSIQVDIWKDTYASFEPTDADSIADAAPLNTSSATKSRDTTLSGWTLNLAAGDTLRLNVDSCSGVTRCAVTLVVERS